MSSIGSRSATQSCAYECGTVSGSELSGTGDSGPGIRDSRLEMRDCVCERGREPPFDLGRLALLAALFLGAALSCLLGHLYPPFHSWDLTWALTGDNRCRLAPRPASGARASFRCSREPDSRRAPRGGRKAGGRSKKRGGANYRRHPRTGQAAPSASFRPSLTSSRHPLRFSSPFVPPWNWQLSCFPTLGGHNRWAERTTLIRDVDYG